jgi:hypothetical protein
MSLYYPVFVEGDIPPALSIGGKNPSPESPWWLFHDLALDSIARGRERQQQVKAAWRPLQDELLESAYEKAREGRDLIANGNAYDARRVLTEYMDESVSRMLTTARGMLSGAAATAR